MRDHQDTQATAEAAKLENFRLRQGRAAREAADKAADAPAEAAFAARMAEINARVTGS